MNKALICVDVQRDFLPGAVLGVPDGDKTIWPLIKLMDRADIIVLTKDWHPENHVSFSNDPQFVDGSWPAHCVAGTEGSDVDDVLVTAAYDTGKPVLIVHKGTDPLKEAYSGFEGTVTHVDNDLQKDHQLRHLPLLEALRALSVDEVLIGGLALDYCVKATALAANSWFSTAVYLDATRPVGYLTGAEAIATMARVGLRLNATELI